MGLKDKVNQLRRELRRIKMIAIRFHDQHNDLDSDVESFVLEVASIDLKEDL